MLHQPSPLQVKSLQKTFPLMDLLVANMEYHSQDYAAFIQQYGLPDTDKKLVRFVERNIMQLQSDKMQRLFAPYYQDRSITTDIRYFSAMTEKEATILYMHTRSCSSESALPSLNTFTTSAL